MLTSEYPGVCRSLGQGEEGCWERRGLEGEAKKVKVQSCPLTSPHPPLSWRKLDWGGVGDSQTYPRTKETVNKETEKSTLPVCSWSISRDTAAVLCPGSVPSGPFPWWEEPRNQGGVSIQSYIRACHFFSIPTAVANRTWRDLAVHRRERGGRPALPKQTCRSPCQGTVDRGGQTCPLTISKGQVQHSVQTEITTSSTFFFFKKKTKQIKDKQKENVQLRAQQLP